MKKSDIAIIVVLVLVAEATVAGLWTAYHHRYTCDEIIGVPRVPGYVSIIPPGYHVGMDLAGNVLYVRDEHMRLVCGPYHPPPVKP